MKFTLRAKGVLAFTALVIYVAVTGYILTQERSSLLRVANELEKVYAEETALTHASYAVAQAITKWHGKVFDAGLVTVFEEQITLDVELAEAAVQDLLQAYPQLGKDIERLKRDAASLRASPSRSGLVSLRDHGQDMSVHLEQMTRESRARKDHLWEGYRTGHDTVSMITVFLGLLGAVFFGVTMTLFLTRLAWDVRSLAARAAEIVSGYRGPPLMITRHDEIGDLMEAVNRMQLELRHHEQQLQVSREQSFHKEKMAAIGSLAAAVAHEINNPIAAIAGIAQSLKDSGRLASSGTDSSDPFDLIMQQAKRITTISRQIAELTAPHSPENELLDLNALARNVCGFIGYDRRFRPIDLVLELDTQIPAISAVADHLTQVLMNLLINAADSLEDVQDPKPRICVATKAVDNQVMLTVTDNGKGMDSAVLERAFEESYTTKPPDKGRGLGLFLCKSLIEGGGNRIELESTPGVGTTARIWLALPPPVGA